MICTKWIITVLVVQENTDFTKEMQLHFFFFASPEPPCLADFEIKIYGKNKFEEASNIQALC